MKNYKKMKEIIVEIIKGFKNNTSGGCCGISLPKEEQEQLKKLKQGKQGKIFSNSAESNVKNEIAK